MGLDQFIGVEDCLNKGLGTLMIKKFTQLLLQNPRIKKIITETDPNNFRAKRCYEKTGFCEVGTTYTPDGKSILMVMLRQDRR